MASVHRKIACACEFNGNISLFSHVMFVMHIACQYIIESLFWFSYAYIVLCVFRSIDRLTINLHTKLCSIGWNPCDGKLFFSSFFSSINEMYRRLNLLHLIVCGRWIVSLFFAFCFQMVGVNNCFAYQLTIKK